MKMRAGLLVIILLSCVFAISDGLSFRFSFSSGSRRSSSLSHDIGSRQGLTNLYNSPVTKVEHVTRPMAGGFQHSGVVVTTGSGDRWLVHKGKGYGESGETVVTNANHMSSAWSSAGSQGAAGGTKVADYVKAGGADYNVATDNCHDGSKRMMDVGGGGR